MKEGESEPIKGGCHASRTDALAHQRALYANESQTAAMEVDSAELIAAFQSSSAPEPVRIEVGGIPNDALPALVASLEALSERLFTTESALGDVVERLALIASVEPPIVNVNVPETVVHVHVPDFPEPRVEITTPAPVVNIELPTVRKTIKFERSLMGSIEGATVEEEIDHGG